MRFHPPIALYTGAFTVLARLGCPSTRALKPRTVSVFATRSLRYLVQVDVVGAAFHPRLEELASLLGFPHLLLHHRVRLSRVTRSNTRHATQSNRIELMQVFRPDEEAKQRQHVVSGVGSAP